MNLLFQNDGFLTFGVFPGYSQSQVCSFGTGIDEKGDGQWFGKGVA
jgi:hypothetical protein